MVVSSRSKNGRQCSKAAVRLVHIIYDLIVAYPRRPFDCDVVPRLSIDLLRGNTLRCQEGVKHVSQLSSATKSCEPANDMRPPILLNFSFPFLVEG